MKPRPSKPAPSKAMDAGSGVLTGTEVALKSPETSDENEPSVVTSTATSGETLAKLRLIALGLPRSLAGITLELNETVSPADAFEAESVRLVPEPKTASLNVPLR